MAKVKTYEIEDAIKEQPKELSALANRIKNAIDEWTIETSQDGFRKHLGASGIGNNCARFIWYGFRWVYKQEHSARMLRLFDRGNREEAAFVKQLRGIGARVWAFDESKPFNEAKGHYPQFRVDFLDGHYGGSLDSIVRLPESFGFNLPLIGEFKTNMTGAGFNGLKDKGGVINHKPLHYAQNCVYGKGMGINHMLYMNVNKNDDDTHIEVVELDMKLADELEKKAKKIIYAIRPPARISEKPTHFECKMCSAHEYCHGPKAGEVNCRSCVKAVAVENKQWKCKMREAIIPDHIIVTGCADWDAINKNE